MTQDDIFFLRIWRIIEINVKKAKSLTTKIKHVLFYYFFELEIHSFCKNRKRKLCDTKACFVSGKKPANPFFFFARKEVKDKYEDRGMKK